MSALFNATVAAALAFTMGLNLGDGKLTSFWATVDIFLIVANLFFVWHNYTFGKV